MNPTLCHNLLLHPYMVIPWWIPGTRIFIPLNNFLTLVSVAFPSPPQIAIVFYNYKKSHAKWDVQHAGFRVSSGQHLNVIGSDLGSVVNSIFFGPKQSFAIPCFLSALLLLQTSEHSTALSCSKLIHSFPSPIMDSSAAIAAIWGHMLLLWPHPAFHFSNCNLQYSS